MPVQNLSSMLVMPSFKRMVLYTGNIMHTSLTKTQQQEKTSNLEVGLSMCVFSLEYSG